LRSIEDAFMAAAKLEVRHPLHLTTIEKVARTATSAVRQLQREAAGDKYDPLIPVAKRLQMMQPTGLLLEEKSSPAAVPATPEHVGSVVQVHWEVDCDDDGWVRYPVSDSVEFEKLYKAIEATQDTTEGDSWLQT